MDREAELVRSENWSELKRFYSSRAGHTWELAWVYLLKIRDQAKAAEEFQRTFQDPRYEEASYILLWKLGKRQSFRRSVGPQSLRLYESYLMADPGPLLHFIQKNPSQKSWTLSLLRQISEHLSAEAVESLQSVSLHPVSQYLLGFHSERRLKRFDLAEIFYQNFIADSWCQRILIEVQRVLFDPDMSRRMRNAYAKRDGITVQRVLKAAQFRLDKVESSVLSDLWKETMTEALEEESHHITENLLGYPFWKSADLSPRVVASMRAKLFKADEQEDPPFVSQWQKFFEGEMTSSPPVDLEPDSLPLWQIRVELDPGLLSEALLRFPNEERFLFLWSVRFQERIAVSEGRKWPENEIESDVVRKNLERAFERSSNKVLWFDRLRQVGCSQSFYEYAIERAAIPLSWILDDLTAGLITASPIVRKCLRDRLSLTQAAQADEKASELLPKVLSYLSPAETQAVLLSRFVLEPLAEEILNDDYIDLLWDARTRVSKETATRWRDEILNFLEKKPLKTLSLRHWRWIEEAWETSPKDLARFSPQVDSGEEFPWSTYLERLSDSDQQPLFLMCLHRIPDERLRESCIRKALLESQDPRIFTAINSLSTDFIRHGLLSLWYQRKDDLGRALSHKEEELATTPILNDQLRISKEILEMHRKVRGLDPKFQSAGLLRTAKFLEANGGLDAELCEELSQIFERLGEGLTAWKFLIQKFTRSNESVQVSILPRLVDLAVRAPVVEETQRFLVDQIFKQNQPGALAKETLNHLLSENSPVRIKHLRGEFIDKASKLFPLHPQLLGGRAKDDYRAVLLWKAFYGGEPKEQASIPSPQSRRDYQLWRLTDSVSQAEHFQGFTKYLNTLPAEKMTSEADEFLDKAERMLARIAKMYSVKKVPKVVLNSGLSTPLRIDFSPAQLVIAKGFFQLLDEEMWSACCVGLLQVLDDREKGLFEEKRLVERFFQGMFLSGAPIAKLVRLWVWMAIHEGLIKPQMIKSEPEELIAALPFVNSLIIFYLGSDFEEKIKSCSIALS